MNFYIIGAISLYYLLKDPALDRAKELIKYFEGYSPTVYSDSNGFQTIGYGHKLKPGENLTLITQHQAEQLLNQDISIAANELKALVSVPLTKNQKIALISLLYNIGGNHFADSKLLEFLNQGKYIEAAAEFGRWVHIGPDGKKRIDPGLDKRRLEERAIFLQA